jgi:hypothetical protein
MSFKELERNFRKDRQKGTMGIRVIAIELMLIKAFQKL